MKFLKHLIPLIILITCFVPIAAAEWQIEFVDSANDVGRYNSIALDGNDRPHISYYNATGNELKYAKWMGPYSWQISTVDGIGNVGMYTSIAIDDQDLPRISYYDYTNGTLKYAAYTKHSPGGILYWDLDTAYKSTWNAGRYTSLALNSSGNPYISYSVGDPVYDLGYAWFDGSYWHSIIFSDPSNFGTYTSIALDSSGNPYISYLREDPNYDLSCRWLVNTWWQSPTIDDSGNVGFYTSIALDRYDNPHISYYDATNGDLKYAWYDGSNWHITIADSQGGWCSSLALDRAGNPHISHFDRVGGDLKYTWHDGSLWHTSIIDSLGDSEGFNSIALDRRGYPHISYYDGLTTALKYARFVPENGIGIYRPSTHIFYLDFNGNGRWDGAVVDRAYNFGLTGDLPVSGDWNTLGRTSIGVFRPSTHMFYIDWNGNGRWDGAVVDRAYNFGLSNDLVVAGNWNADTFLKIGVFRPSTHTFYLDYNGNGVWDGATTDRAYNFGLTGDIPVSGDWNALGGACIGVFRPSTHTFYLDYNGNGRWDGAVTDRQYNYGLTGDSPVSGVWG